MKETHYKLKHRVTALFAAAVMLCSMLPGAAFAEGPTPQPTEETVQMEQQTEPSETDNGQADESSPDPGEDVTEATPETAEEQPAEEEIPAAVVGAELYTDLPDAPIGSYIGSEGLPVATGETKIGISEWPESQLEEGGSYLTAVALDNDSLTMAAPLLDGADYAIVPIMAQVEYPADGSSTDMILPDGVTLLDFYGEPATDADALLHNSYHETSAAVMGVYVQAAADFTAQLVYTGPDGSTQTKTLYVTIDREHTVASPFADAGIAAYGERPIPNVTDLVQRRTRLLLHPRRRRPAQELSNVHLCQYFYGWRRPVCTRRPLWQPVQNLGRFNPAFVRYAGAPSGSALRRSAEFAGFLPHDLYRCADADYRELS